MIYKLEPGAIKPTKAHSTDAGFDLYTPTSFTLHPHSQQLIDIGVHLAIPEGYYGQIQGRSGLASEGIFPIGGVIDSGYTGSIRVNLINHSLEAHMFMAGSRIAQLVILPVPAFVLEEGELEATERGSNGFGSSGK